jgi:hypothetical protein
MSRDSLGENNRDGQREEDQCSEAFNEDIWRESHRRFPLFEFWQATHLPCKEYRLISDIAKMDK